MPTNRKVIDFKIHNLTEEQFQELKEAGQIDPNAIYCTPDKTVANFEAVNARIDAVDEEIEALKDKDGIPLLSHMWADHTLNDISWLNADTFSWQSGDVYVAAYEHLLEDYENRIGKGTESDGWLTEIIDGVTVYYVVAPDGHKICMQDNEVNVQAIYEATGVAWYYILDIKNKQFKLPRTKHAFTGLRDTVGKYVPAGVPDITGRAEVVGYTTTTGGAWSTGGSLSGSVWTRKTAGAVNTNGYEFDGQLRFTASHSNSIYGSSNTVQPPATQMYLYFYVGNFEREAIKQTAGLNAELFNSKADNNLKNTPLQVDSTGKILVSGTTLAQSTNNRELRLQVGSDVTNGSLLALYGQNSTQGAAGFLLRACLEEGKYNDLVGRADGLLAWKGERIPCLKSEQLPTIDNGYAWYKVYDDGFVIQGGRCIGEWPIAQGAEQVPYVTMAIPMNTTHIYPFFTCKEVYCLPMGWYMANSTTLRPRFGAYTVARTLTQFDWVAFGRKA